MVRSWERAQALGLMGANCSVCAYLAREDRISKERAVWYCRNSSSLETQCCFLTAQACLSPSPGSAQFQMVGAKPVMSPGPRGEQGMTPAHGILVSDHCNTLAKRPHTPH